MKKIDNKTKKMLEIEKNRGVDVEEVIRQLYVDKNVRMHELCEELSISHTTALEWLSKAGIYSRKLDLG